MKKSLCGIGMVALLTLSGCVTIPSQPRTFDQLGNFSVTPLNNKTYRVGFQGSPNMSFGTAEEIALLKAAQTSAFQGYQYFKVLDDPSNRSQQRPRQAVVYPAPMHPYGYGYRRFPGYFDPYYNFPPQVVNVDPVQVSYTIECYKDKKTAPSDAFEAQLILQSLGPKYGLSATGQVLQPQPAQIPPKP
jgi:hypothetical protein